VRFGSLVMAPGMEAAMVIDVLSGNLQARAESALRASPIHELRDVNVEQQGDTIILTGVVSSYYYKQLAQEAVRSVLRNHNVEVLNQIEVRPYSFDRD